MSTARRLTVGIMTTGRFHACDLARELDARGHRVAFYSWVPPKRTRRFGLPDRCNRWMLPVVAAEFALARLCRGTRLAEAAAHRLAEAYDRAVARTLERCDVLIAMSGMGSATLAAARRRFGAKLWVERGSRHILSQRAILASIHGAAQVQDWSIKRELADYDRADIVSVLSQHCQQSFEDYGFPPRRLVRNPLGVELSMFPPTPAPPADPPTVLTAGAWSLRKGCDVLDAACTRLAGVRLLHVGPVADCPLPSRPGFVHLPPVDQTELKTVYAQGHVFALASREEGLALVQPQALACGLRLVCTERTGGADLADYADDPSSVTVVPVDDPDRLAEALRIALDRSLPESGSRDRLGGGRARITWAAYAGRYEQNLYERM